MPLQQQSERCGGFSGKTCMLCDLEQQRVQFARASVSPTDSTRAQKGLPHRSACKAAIRAAGGGAGSSQATGPSVTRAHRVAVHRTHLTWLILPSRSRNFDQRNPNLSQRLRAGGSINAACTVPPRAQRHSDATAHRVSADLLPIFTPHCRRATSRAERYANVSLQLSSVAAASSSIRLWPSLPNFS